VIAPELGPLRELWQRTPEPSEQTRADARARLFEAIGGAVPSVALPAPRTTQHALPRRRLGLVLAVMLIVLLLLASVAVAFGLRVLVFGEAQKAPAGSRVFKTFSEFDLGAPPGMKTGVTPNQTRKVATFGDKTLWVAPTSQGGFCMLLTDAAGGCDRLGTVPLNLIWSSPSGTNPRSRTRLGGWVVTRIIGDVNARWASSVEIRFQDGDVIRPQIVWVSQPIDAGFFVEHVPAEHQQPGHLISAVVAVDRAGEDVASESLPPDRSAGPPADAILDQAKQVAAIQTDVGQAVLRTAPTRYGGRCTWLEFAGKATPVVPCLPQGYEHRQVLAYAVHALGGSFVLAGECGYSAVELLHRNRGVRRVECTHGVVLAALSAEDASGQLRALDRDGRPIPKSTNDVAKAIAEDRR
jgi:hypothetical protein